MCIKNYYCEIMRPPSSEALAQMRHLESFVRTDTKHTLFVIERRHCDK